MYMEQKLKHSIQKFCKSVKPSEDPNCQQIFNKLEICSGTDFICIKDNFHSRPYGTWTEPYGTVQNQQIWFAKLITMLNNKYGINFHYRTVSESGITFITW